MQFRAKQVSKFIIGHAIPVTRLALSGGSEIDVTAQVAVAATHSGYGGHAIPYVPAVMVEDEMANGFVVDAPHNRVEMTDVDGVSLADSNRNMVYGRLTYEDYKYILRTKVKVSGQELPFTMPADGEVILHLPYLYTFGNLPYDLLARNNREEPRRGAILVENNDGTYTWQPDIGNDVFIAPHLSFESFPTTGNFDGRLVFAYGNWYIYQSGNWFEATTSGGSSVDFVDNLDGSYDITVNGVTTTINTIQAVGDLSTNGNFMGEIVSFNQSLFQWTAPGTWVQIS